MKTKELIRQLQLANPEGEAEVCIGNADIHFVEPQYAYYDGALEVLKRDEEKKDCYNIIGAEFRRKGIKIVIHTLSIEDAIVDNPDLPVTYDSEGMERHKEQVEKWRAETKAIIENIDKDNQSLKNEMRKKDET